MELLHKAGIQQIISPIKTIHGKPTQRIEDFTLTVCPHRSKAQFGNQQKLREGLTPAEAISVAYQATTE